MTASRKIWATMILTIVLGSAAGASEPTSNENVHPGEQAVRQATTPVAITLAAYENLWQSWGLAERPAAFAKMVQARYGLIADPANTEGLPWGLQQGRVLGRQGLKQNCLLCHAGSVAGQTIIGLGNASLDFQSLVEDLHAGDLPTPVLPFTLSQVRGTVEATASAVFLNQYRNPDLSLRLPVDSDIPDELCEDIPAWWHLKRKQTMYHTGTTDARSVRTMMSFLLSPLHSATYIKRQEPSFREIQKYLLSLQPPKYPFEIDEPLAEEGKILFRKNCARCHGTYGPQGRYPNRVIPLAMIGTDSALAVAHEAIARQQAADSWLQEERIDGRTPYVQQKQIGYQAPPLDGVWATAPYFHNGSVPTVFHVLDSAARPKIHTRSYRTDAAAYDRVKLGWKIREIAETEELELPKLEQRKIYDTSRPGRGNAGHRFGDKLTAPERMAVIEYLKTL